MTNCTNFIGYGMLPIFALSVACTSTYPSLPEMASIKEQFSETSKTDKYFMDFTFDQVSLMADGTRAVFRGDFKREWYSNQLAALNEPSLISRLDPDTLFLRFLWLRTFNNPVAIRLEIVGSSEAVLFFAMGDGLGGYEPGDVSKSQTRQLTDDELGSLNTFIADAEICRSRFVEPIAIDGAQWIFEQRHGNNYCAVDIHSPKLGELAGLGLYLLDLASFKETEDQPIY